MIDVLSVIGREHECLPVETTISGRAFSHFFRPVVETALAVGKVSPCALDPLIVLSPQGMLCIAKTAREKGDGEGAAYFLSKSIISDRTSYLCLDFNKKFLDFCRSVRQDDQVHLRIGREFEFLNIDRARQERKELLRLSSKSVYQGHANSLEDIRKEMDFALGLLAEAPKRWTSRLVVPAREVKKFYCNVWRYQHRALFYHVVNGDNAVVMAYSEDALREMNEQEVGWFKISSPKRRFFMARQFVRGEDGVRCGGWGSAVFRANFSVLAGVAESGLDFEFTFSDGFDSPYGITVKSDRNCFRMICENTIGDQEKLCRDLKDTLFGMVAMSPIKTVEYDYHDAWKIGAPSSDGMERRGQMLEEVSKEKEITLERFL